MLYGTSLLAVGFELPRDFRFVPNRFTLGQNWSLGPAAYQAERDTSLPTELFVKQNK